MDNFFRVDSGSGKIRVAEIYKVLETQGIAFSELPSSWPNHSTAEVNAIIMTGEEAAVTLVSHELEEEVELWLHHFNSTNASQLKHLVESVAVYLRMCGDDKDVEEFTRRVEEFAELCGKPVSTGDGVRLARWRLGDFFCFFNPLALLSKSTDVVLGWDTTRRPLIWTFWWRKLASRTPTIHAATLCNWQCPMSTKRVPNAPCALRSFQMAQFMPAVCIEMGTAPLTLSLWRSSQTIGSARVTQCAINAFPLGSTEYSNPQPFRERDLFPGWYNDRMEAVLYHTVISTCWSLLKWHPYFCSKTISNRGQELGAFVDCFCVAKRHERDCRRDHAVELQLVQKQVHDIVQRFEGRKSKRLDD